MTQQTLQDVGNNFQVEETKQVFADGEKVYLKEDNNVSQIVCNNPYRDWSILWERLPKDIITF